MSKVCEKCGKKPDSGHNVSHSVRRTKRRFLPNLLKKRIFNPLKNLFESKRVCTKCLKTIRKTV